MTWLNKTPSFASAVGPLAACMAAPGTFHGTLKTVSPVTRALTVADVTLIGCTLNQKTVDMSMSASVARR